jgi:copper chaperone NosL
MKLKNKLLLVVASIILFAVFLYPLWKIHLDAPQYPEGLGVNIWIHNITALHPHNLETINDLNHYIGMKAIEPDSVPELKIMPYAIIFIALFGFVVIVFNKRLLLTGWLVTFTGLATAGMIDFYLWLYDYGHNLDPDAAIKIPGMSFQPPIFGSRQLLNIHVTSYPGLGGILVIISLLIGIYVLVNEIILSKKGTKQKG